MFVPAGVHIDAEYSNNDKGQTRHGGAQPFIYPMGVGGVLMNGCYGRDYQKGDPCYAAKRMSTKCLVSEPVQIFLPRSLNASPLTSRTDIYLSVDNISRAKIESLNKYCPLQNVTEKFGTTLQIPGRT